MIDFNPKFYFYASREGRLWFADGVCAPCEFKGCPITFAETQVTRLLGQSSDISPDSIQFRVLGSPDIAPYILEWWPIFKKADNMHLCLIGPQVCNSQEELDNPVVSLFRMRQCQLPGSLGGWQWATDYDIETFAVLMDESRALENHPLWRVASFVDLISEVSVRALLWHIIDPRWFIDPRDPLSDKRLRRYLGVTPKCVANLLQGRGGVRVRRLQTVLDCWQRDGAIEQAPGDFIRRTWATAESEQHGLFVASSLFVSFIFQAWQQHLLDKQGRSVELFLPRMLFTPQEAEAYKVHCVF